MALTNSVIQNTRTVFGNKRVVVLTTDFDSSYPRGGESLTPNDLGMDSIDMMLISPQDGYSFEYDYSNKLLKSYNTEPTLIVEEVVTVTSHVGTLVQLPFYIVAIDVTAGGNTGPFNIVPTGETPATLQCAVTFTNGVLTFPTGDAVTSVRVTYIPQHSDGPFSAANMVVDEIVAANSGTPVALANRACMVQYVYNNTNSTMCTMKPVGFTPPSTNTAAIDITSGSDTTVDTPAADGTDSLLITYIKYAPFPSTLCIGDADVTLSSEIYSFNTDGGYLGLVVPGLGTHCVTETAASAAQADYPWSGPSIGVDASLPVWTPHLNLIETNDSTALITTAMPWLVLDPNILGTRLSETPAGRDMSTVTSVRIQVWGS